MQSKYVNVNKFKLARRTIDQTTEIIYKIKCHDMLSDAPRGEKEAIATMEIRLSKVL